MAMPQSVDRFCTYLKKVAKNIEYRYNRRLRDKSIQEAVEINKCAGELGVCEEEFKKNIIFQCKAVREAREGGFNESVQMQIVIDSAVGYLLVREAQFALKTLRNFDSMEIALDMLETAALTIQGKKESVASSLRKLVRKRPGYEYIYSPEAYEEKYKVVKGFIEELVRTGDIETCVKNRNSSAGGNEALTGQPQAALAGPAIPQGAGAAPGASASVFDGLPDTVPDDIDVNIDDIINRHDNF